MPSSRPSLVQEVHAIVTLGEFNPMIFHPAWFANNNLLPEEETAEAEGLVVTRELSTFQVSDIHVQVEQGRFGLTTKNPAQAPLLLDLAEGCFRLLEHTPINHLGLNLDLEYEMPSVEDWHAVGDRLAPKAPWSGILSNPGMRAVVMEGQRDGCDADRVHVRVQPTNRVQAVFVGVNQHYNIKTEARQSVRERNAEAIRVVNEDWNSFRRFAKDSALAVITDQAGE